MSTRLQTELARLYHLADPLDPQARAAVLGLAHPADWLPLAAVWRGVQEELGLPAPAIAIAGPLGYELWFSLPAGSTEDQAHALLSGLRERYLAELPAQRVRLWPGPQGHAAPAPALPPQPLAPGEWTAFVAPDLAPVFADEPWLDTPPNPEGQADLLARLKTIAPDALAQALEALHTPPTPEGTPAPTTLTAAAQPAEPASGGAPGQAASGPAIAPTADPVVFLTAVMNDPGVAMALRIEAARALLQDPRRAR